MADELDRLFQAPLEAFVRERQRLAADLRRAGCAAQAQAVKGLSKPTRVAWLMNQIYWRARADFDGVVAAGERLRAAQQARLSGDTAASVVTASELRDRAIERALRAAETLVGAEGPPLSPEQRQRLRLMLETVAARPLRDLTVVPGRFVEELGPSGFSAIAGLAPPPAGSTSAAVDAAPRSTTRAEGADLTATPPGDDLRVQAERSRAREAAFAQALAERHDAARDLSLARALVEDTQARAGAARVAVQSLDRRLTELERERDQARRALAGAEDAVAAALRQERDVTARLSAADERVSSARREADR